MTHPCKWCGRQLYTATKISTAGWIVMLVGLVLSPVCVGIILVPVGFLMKEKFVECEVCGKQI